MRVQQVYFLKGLPACGKSTYARKIIEEKREDGIIAKRINKDDLRAMMDNSVHSKEREKFVLEVRDQILWIALLAGNDVIIDDTNLASKHLEAITELINNFNKIISKDENRPNVILKEMFFDVPVKECILRDSKRENPVGEKVIRNMYNRYLKKENVPKVSYDPKLPNCIIVDVDGTLAIRNNRSPYEYWKSGEDTLNTPVADLVFSLQRNYDLTTIIMTGRENLCDEDGFTVSLLTQKWLDVHHIHFDDIFIRANEDHRPDYEVKAEMYEENIKGNYNVLYVIDDRKQVIDMWREKGLMVLDVAGNDF